MCSRQFERDTARGGVLRYVSTGDRLGAKPSGAVIMFFAVDETTKTKGMVLHHPGGEVTFLVCHLGLPHAAAAAAAVAAVAAAAAPPPRRRRRRSTRAPTARARRHI